MPLASTNATQLSRISDRFVSNVTTTLALHAVVLWVVALVTIAPFLLPTPTATPIFLSPYSPPASTRTRRIITFPVNLLVFRISSENVTGILSRSTLAALTLKIFISCSYRQQNLLAIKVQSIAKCTFLNLVLEIGQDGKELDNGLIRCHRECFAASVEQPFLRG